MKQEAMLFGTKTVSSGCDTIDLRSDVVTKPSQEMLNDMVAANVGNDGWREDPTVTRMEHRIADLLGKDAAILTPSGTMANQIAVRLLTSPGNEVIVERSSHMFNFETAGPATLSGVQLLPLKGRNGILSWADIEPNIRPQYHQFPQTLLISLENTHNNGGGKVYPIDLIKEISFGARKRGIHLHLDGARLFNASVAANLPVHYYAAHFDLVTVCLSKSLGCPGGSVLAGSADKIERALVIRRQFGGSMRQIAGYMAAAGLYALDHNIERLAEDHEHARMIADAISRSKGLRLVTQPETNIVLFEPQDELSPEQVCAMLKDSGVLVAAYNFPFLRAVTHLDVDRPQVESVVKSIERLFG